jgi:acyl dehydratase
MDSLAFEDVVAGTLDTPGAITVTRDDIVAFGRAYDPQPFHVDEEAAKDTPVGRLIASGWHSCCVLMRLNVDGWLGNSTSMGAPGLEEVRWLLPVLPGDTLRSRRTIRETKASRSRPEMGLIHLHCELLNQKDEVVLTQTNWIMLARRGVAVPPGRAPEQDAPAPPPEPGDGGILCPFEDLEIGRKAVLGHHTFGADDIIDCARRWDPQPFHVDPEAGRRSHFGALCASGWQTAALWMRAMVAHRERGREAARAQGLNPARLGPSPGFKDLRWLKPVYPGDTVTYRSEVVDKRPLGSKPGWGLVFNRNTGDNQRGERVLEFTGAVFWERRSR